MIFLVGNDTGIFLIVPEGVSSRELEIYCKSSANSATDSGLLSAFFSNDFKINSSSSSGISFLNSLIDSGFSLVCFCKTSNVFVPVKGGWPVNIS